ncbi:MAG TPA: hypothetical protein PKB13_04715 [Clostridia bacterium]|nr:hypothetical protein [Clostridia bacterium]
MTEWWESLSTLQRVFGFFALPATLVLIIQSVLVLFGIGHHEVDLGHAHVDVAHDHMDASDGFALFSVRGLVAFFSVGGWTGIVLDGVGASPVITILLSLAAGTAALYAVALLFRMAAKLQSSGNIELKNAVGKNAKVYIPIPAKEKGTGKVTLILQERFVECDAFTRASRGLKTGELVRVVAVVDENTLIVEPENVKIEQVKLEV